MIGKAHVLARDHINTDEIIPARYLNVHGEYELARHVMEDIDARFVHRVKVGDFIVAGENFGCGSSREHAVWALRGAGVRAVLADSFARIFYRNAINNGFCAIEIKGISGQVKDGDTLEINPEEGKVYNRSSGQVTTFAPFSGHIQEIISAGGLLKHITSQKKVKRSTHGTGTV
jgi:3-isopropylmalate/(R)-2-methylmalate dehydratase small subunit